MVSRLRPTSSARNERRSPAAKAADRVGKTASENDTPIRLTGRTW